MFSYGLIQIAKEAINFIGNIGIICEFVRFYDDYNNKGNADKQEEEEDNVNINT